MVRDRLRDAGDAGLLLIAPPPSSSPTGGIPFPALVNAAMTDGVTDLIGACDFCHLPLPRGFGRLRPEATVQGVYCCYGCSLAARISGEHGAAGRTHWMLARLGVSIVLLMGLMVFSLCLYGDDVFEHATEAEARGAATLSGLLRYLSLLFATPIFLLLGVPILQNAVDQWRSGVASTDALIVLGVAAAFVYSYVSTLADHGGTYYETACVILVFVTLGRYLEAKGKLQASNAMRLLEQFIPNQVTVRRGTELLHIPGREIRVGDIALVPSGEHIPADGVVIDGYAHLDNRLMTGEAKPVAITTGDAVIAGAVNLDGHLSVQVAAVGERSTLGRIAALIERAKRSKGAFERLAERIARFFVPVTVVLAAVAFAAGWYRGGLDDGLLSFLATLLIACPCALGIATPMAVWVGLGRAAAQGVLFKDTETIERLARVSTVCFDKTGTLTDSAPVVASAHYADTEPEAQARVLAIAGALAATSRHVLSDALVRFAQERGAEQFALADAQTISGLGVAGTFDGERAYLGSRRFMNDRGLRLNGFSGEAAHEASSSAVPTVFVGWQGRVRAVFRFAERIRPEARSCIERLRRAGKRTIVLTGDNRDSGSAVAAQLGIPVAAGLTPEQKLASVGRGEAKSGLVAMVGDGVNDAAALAAADVGIAMGCGTDVARDAASVCLLSNNLEQIPWAIDLARRVVATIKLNLFWAFIYNIAGVGLAIAGKLTPVFAAVAMVASSLLVVSNSLRLWRTNV